MKPIDPIVRIVAALVALTNLATAEILFTASDNFDGTFETMTTGGSGDVDSFEWRSANSATAVAAYSYSASRLVNVTDRGALGYFTAPGSPATLAAGQTITLVANLTYDRSGGNTGDRLRVGLYNSLANPNAINGTGFTPTPNSPPNEVSRPQTNYDNNSSTVGSGFVNLYNGLQVDRLSGKTSAGDVAETNVEFYERLGNSTANSVIGGSAIAGVNGFTSAGSGGNAFTIPGGGWYNTSTLARTPLRLIFSVNYVGIDGGTGKNKVNLSYQLLANYTGNYEVVNSFSVANYLTDVPMAFDTVALYERSAYANFDDITVTIDDGSAAFEVPVLSILRVDDNLEIRCPSTTGFNYQLGISGTLSGWMDTGVPQAGTGGELLFTRPYVAPANFYRVGVSTAP